MECSACVKTLKNDCRFKRHKLLHMHSRKYLSKISFAKKTIHHVIMRKRRELPPHSVAPGYPTVSTRNCTLNTAASVPLHTEQPALFGGQQGSICMFWCMTGVTTRSYYCSSGFGTGRIRQGGTCTGILILGEVGFSFKFALKEV